MELSSLPGEVDKTSMGGKEEPKDLNIESNDLNNFFSRPRFLKRVSWQAADMHEATLSLGSIYDLWRANTSVANRLKNYSSIRLKLHVRLEVNGTPYHCGRLMCTWMHSGGRSDGNSFNTCGNSRTLRQRSTLMNVKLDPTSKSAYELELPFASPYGYINLYDSSSYYDTFRVEVLNELSSQLSPITAVMVNVYGWATEVELSVPALQSELSGAISKVVRDVPRVVRGFASTFARAGIDAGLSSVGLGSPQLPNLPSEAEPKMTVFGHSDQPCKSVTFGHRRLVEAPLDSLDGEGDNLDIERFTGREALLGRVTWPVGGSPSLLAGYTVHPGRIVDVVGTGMLLTPAGLVNSMFEYWKGDMEFRFEIVANKFVRGKLRARYIPRGGALSQIYIDDVADVHSVLIDVSENTEFTIRAPYSSSRPWLFCGYLDDSTTDLRMINGCVILEYVEPLQSAVPIQINVYSRGVGMRFGNLLGIKNGNDYSAQDSLLALAPQLQAGGVVEEYVSLRDAMKALEPACSFLGYDGGDFAEVDLPTIPFSPLQTPSHVIANGTPGWQEINYGRLTRLAAISACFFGSTGSFRRALTETNTYVTAKTSRTLFKSSMTAAGMINGVASPTVEYFQNTDAIVTFTTENELANLTVDVPQQRPMVFQVPKGLIHSGTSASMLYLFPGKTDLVVFEGAGDDYALHFFQFVPFLFARPNT